MFKTMGYSPGLLVKMGQFRTLAKSREIHPNNHASTYKSICEHVIGVSGSLERFPTLTKIGHVQNHALVRVLSGATWSISRLRVKNLSTQNQTHYLG